MTDARPPRRRKPSAYPVVAASLAAFMGLFGFMAHQLRTGHDPALGNQVAAAPAPTAKRVVVKRIEHRVIVTKLLPPRESDDDSGDGQPAGAPVTTSAPVATGAPMVRSAPATPQPAPAAAPVVTRSS